ncbi:MAG: BlaI/MecI/CopY family transcriptional regulator [Bacteroidetes bacterium]|nr:BlaI/MecI/CopY family transcriptional regulator [Bacteroidota bacterium]
MPNASPPMPTPAELEILRVLWHRGPSTVREVQTALGEASTGYTTVLKQLQLMHEKALVTRDESQRAHVYAAGVDASITQRQLVDDLVDRAFGGATDKLVLRALSSERVTPEELSAIRDLLDELDDED